MSRTSKRPARAILDYAGAIESRGWSQDSTWFRNKQAQALYAAFHGKKKCPFCGVRTTPVLTIDTTQACEGGRIVEVFACFRCGWWARDWWHFEMDDSPGHHDRAVALLREFSAADRQVPLAALERELRRRPDLVYDIHTKKFEELVAAVLSDHHACEVTIVGRTGDGGLDLLYLDGDDPHAVQVKRREDPNSTETVALVREFLGAMLLQGLRRGTIVTTADHFSRGAEVARNEAMRRQIVQGFDLIDGHRFYELFKSRSIPTQYPWEAMVDDCVTGFRDFEGAIILQWAGPTAE